LRERFDKLWINEYDGIFTTQLNQKSLQYLEAMRPVDANTRDLRLRLIDELRRAPDADESETSRNVEKQRLQIPDWLNYETGDFAHQGQAIEAWKLSGYKGIMAIATGGGKTLTSLTGASLLMHDEGKVFVVVAVPTKPLLEQWAEEVRLFGLKPQICNGLSPASFKSIIKMAFKRLRFGVSQAECIIVTHEALKTELLAEISTHKRDVGTLLIADEVHNLGSLGFQSAAPDFFDYKLGLSATHERQYDEVGSNFLLEYFGGLVFEY
jgi:superfamily II DNA or RNA helicase